MNETDKRNAKRYRGKNVHKDRYSKEARKDKDIRKFGYHITDHAVVRYLDRVMHQPIERYRHERIVPAGKADEVSGWKEGYEKYIELNNYQLVIKNQTVVTVLPPKGG